MQKKNVQALSQSSVLLSDNINEYVKALSRVVDRVHVVDNGRRCKAVASDRVVPITVPPVNGDAFLASYIERNGITNIYAQGRKSLLFFWRIARRTHLPQRIIVTCHNSAVFDNLLKSLIFLLIAALFSDGIVFLARRPFLKWRFMCRFLHLPAWNLPNPVEMERFPFTRRKYDAAEIVIGSVGVIAPQKGQDVLVCALSRLIKKGVNVRIKFVGDVEDDSFQTCLCKLVSEYQMEDRVEWVGQVDYCKIPEFLQNVDLYVCPSYHEVMPFSILEAMASGLPIIASDIAGIPDLVHDGINGFLVKAGRADLLASAIEKIIAEKLILPFGEKSRCLADSEFSCQIIAPRMAEILMGSE